MLPRRGSGGWSGIIPIMADATRRDGGRDRAAVLAGAWVLVAGPDSRTAARLRGRLADLGAAAVELVSDPEEAVARATAARPDAVLALPGFAAALRERLDPLELGAAPPVVGMDDLAGLPA